MTGPILSVRDLVTEIQIRGGKVRPVDGISLEVQRGSIVGLVGESGSGKSMTAYSILNLFPTKAARVVAGSVILETVDMVTATEAERESVRGASVGMVFQDYSVSFNPVIPIGHQLLEQLETHGRRKDGKAKVLSVLEEVGLSQEVYGRYPHELSGGMLQRVGIASALVCDPDIIIADEPTTALDVTIQAQILDLLMRIQKERNLSILLITHDLGIVAEICNRVYVMYVGNVVEIADVEDLFRDPKHPYTQGLLRGATISQDASTGGISIPMAGNIPNLREVPSGCRFHDRCPYAMEICKHEPPPFFKSDSSDVACWLFQEGLQSE